MKNYFASHERRRILREPHKGMIPRETQPVSFIAKELSEKSSVMRHAIYKKLLSEYTSKLSSEQVRP